MIADWMLYCVLVSSLLGIGALALEKGARLCGVPVRGVWACAMLSSVLLAATPWLLASRGQTVPSMLERSETVTARPSPRKFSLGAAGSVEAVEPSRSGSAPRRPVDLERPLVVLWGLLSATAIVLLSGAAHNLRRRRRVWRRIRVDGMTALLSRDTGPAVVGFIACTIVLPEWVTAMDPSRRRLVIAHEEEHLRAGDARLLGLALATLAVIPWNLPLWWQLRRLRHALETDCDGRVLARFPDPRAYGSLLVEVGERASGQAFPIAAFSESSSLLERRIRAMFSRKPKSWKAIATVCASLSALLVTFACEVPLPTMPSKGPGKTQETAALTSARKEIMIPPELMDATFPKINEVAAALVRERYPKVFADGLPDGQAVWFAADGNGDIQASWIGPTRAEPPVRTPTGCGTAALPCREGPRGSPARRAAASREEQFEHAQFREHVPEMQIEFVLASGARIADGSHFDVMFASERSVSHGPYNTAVGEHARVELRRNPIRFETSSSGRNGASREEELIRSRYPHLYASGLSPDSAVWIAVDRRGIVRKSWIGPAGFLPAALAGLPMLSGDEMRRLGKEHLRREADYLRTQVPELGSMEVVHNGDLVRNWRYHVRVNRAVQR
jgi:hypothetical protein